MSRGQSRRWLARHRADAWARRARDEGYRSRAAWKLEQLDRRDRLLKPGKRVVDLGAAPGGWSQYAAARLRGRGLVLAVDRVPVQPLPGVEVLEGDFLDAGTRQRIRSRLGPAGADLVMSDMAPNITGNRLADQARFAELAREVVAFAREILAGDGVLVMKLFEGDEIERLRHEIRPLFRELHVRKPEASRSESRELYVVARAPSREQRKP